MVLNWSQERTDFSSKNFVTAQRGVGLNCNGQMVETSGFSFRIFFNPFWDWWQCYDKVEQQQCVRLRLPFAMLENGRQGDRWRTWISLTFTSANESRTSTSRWRLSWRVKERWFLKNLWVFSTFFDVTIAHLIPFWNTSHSLIVPISTGLLLM